MMKDRKWALLNCCACKFDADFIDKIANFVCVHEMPIFGAVGRQSLGDDQSVVSGYEIERGNNLNPTVKRVKPFIAQRSSIPTRSGLTISRASEDDPKIL